MLNAETGQRGYIITSEVRYLAPYYQSLSALKRSVSDLANHVSNDAEQDQLVRSLRPLIERKHSEMAESIVIASENGFEAAKVFIQSHSGLSEMDAIRATLAAMSAKEAVRLVHWEQQYAERQTWMIASMGGFLISVLLLLFFLARASQRAQRVGVQLATEHARFSGEISAKAAQLERDRNDMQAINSVAGYLQSSSSIPQVGKIISEFYSKRSNDIYGALYIFANSRNHLEIVSSFGARDLAKIIDPEQCWGLRQGRFHTFKTGGISPCCDHLDPVELNASTCHPLIAHGEALGVLVVASDHTPSSEDNEVVRSSERIAAAVAQHLALAVANLKLRDTLKEQSIRDPLTGAFNRRHFEIIAEKETAQSVRHDRPFAILMIDIDHFKKYNDLHGHSAGDRALFIFADHIRRHTRAADWLFRMGGEEFLLLLREAEPEAAELKAQRLLDGVAKMQIDLNGQILPSITASIGMAMFHGQEKSIEQTLSQADQALYKAKAGGRNRVVHSKV